MSMLKMLCALMLATLCSFGFASNAYSLRPGYYHETPDEIMKIEKEADLTVFCNGVDKLDIGITNADKYAPRINFTRQQLRLFFERQKHKRLLVVRMWVPISVQDLAKDFEPYKSLSTYFAGFNYERVVYLGNCCEGVQFIRDVRLKHVK